MSSLKFNASLNLIYRENNDGTVDVVLRGVSDEELGLYMVADLLDVLPNLDTYKGRLFIRDDAPQAI